MSCKDNLIPILIIFYILAFLGYLVVSVFVVPANANCDSMNFIPQDAAIDLSMADWIIYNMIAGVVIFSTLGSLAKGKRGDSTCLLVFFIIVCALYCLFEIVWGIIGIILFQQTYQDACAYSDSFNSYVIAELVYGMILFPSILICAIVLAIVLNKKEKPIANVAESGPILNEPILPAETTAVQPEPQQTPNRNSNVYQDIYNRLSGSFGSSSEGRIN